VRRLPCLALFTPLLVAATSLAPQEAAKVFGAREMVQHIDISPDGRSVVYIAPGPGKRTMAYVASLETLKPKAVLTSDADPETLRWCNFVSNTRMVCQITALVDLEGRLIPVSRLFAIDANGANSRELGQKQSFYDERLRQYDGSILDWRPAGDLNSVLMAREYIPEAGRIGTHISRTADGLGVDRVDTVTLKSTPVERPNKMASDYFTDGRGAVRIMEVQPVRGATGQLSARTQYKYRLAGSSDWKDLGSYDINSRDGILPRAVDADLNAAYVLKKLNGRRALYRIKLDGTMATELVYANDKVDVDDVVRIGRGQRVIGVTFAEDKRRTIYFDPEFKALSAALSKAIPKLPLVQFGGASADGSKLLVFAGSDSDPGRYYVYDKARRSLNEIMLVRPALEQAALATVRPISYPAGDGTQVPAYLTLPPGKEDARGLPAVVLPHGGPSSRDEWGFDWLSQFLASQGYAVLQPNYRGSEGYGEEWLQKNGFQSWRTSIGDVTAGARWLAGQGIADPGRMAIVGWSYGGYAALQSEVAEPGLFKAVVAIAPVTDLGTLKEQYRYFTSFRLASEYIGSGPHVREGSPLQNAERITAPVLLVHGTRDFNVAVSHSQKMERQLRAAGKKVEYIELPGLEHSLADSEARARILERTAAFLATHLK
jgi:dienelactone hydrolase